MKKILFVLATFTGLMVSAQKSAVESAAIYLRNGEMEDAQKSIDAAANNDETKNDPKMWYYRAAVYDTLVRNPNYEKMAGPDGIEKLAIACKQCVETDTKDRYKEYCDYAIVNTAFLTYNKAIEFVQAKDPVNAAKYFQYTLDVIPYDKGNDLKKNNINEKNILLSLADLGLKTNDYKLAKTNLQKLIDMDYQDPIVYLLMGNINLTEGDTTKGMGYIENGRTKFPTDKDLINMELNVYMAQGRQDILLKKLDDAIALDNENITLLFVRGNVYDNYASNTVKQGRSARDTSAVLAKKAKAQTNPAAKAKLETASKNYAKLSDSLIRNSKDYVAKAEADYKRVIELKDDYIDAYYNIGALTNNKTTEIVEKMNALSAPSQAEYDKKFAAMKKDNDAILVVALGYFSKALELAEGLPETDAPAKEYKNATLRSILLSMQQVYANLGDEKKTIEMKRRRTELEAE